MTSFNKLFTNMSSASEQMMTSISSIEKGFYNYTQCGVKLSATSIRKYSIEVGKINVWIDI